MQFVIYGMILPVWAAQMELKLFHNGKWCKMWKANGKVASNTFIFFSKAEAARGWCETGLKGNMSFLQFLETLLHNNVT